ncbi:MAG: hypothetical protein IAG10_00730 [Planctomycetaceae bacterium]|nr:hypothetical protein [Planctomycetaceae bacterium]
MIHNFGLPLEQDSHLPSNSEQVENLPHASGWAKLIATRSHLAEQVESACRSLALGDFELAGNQFRGLLRVAQTDHDILLAEVSCHNLAIALRQSGHWLAAEGWQQQSQAWQLRRSSGSSRQSDDDLARLACDLTGRGCDAFLDQDWDLAESLWRRALAIEEWRGSWEGRATDSGNLGLLAAARGDLKSGTRWLQESLRLHRLMFDDIGVGTDSMNLAELYRLQGNFPRMTRSLQQAAKRFERADAHELLEQARRRLKEAARIEAVLKCDVRLN